MTTTYFASLSHSQNLAVFYHVHQHGKWQQLFTEQSRLLIESGLAEKASFVHVGINGAEDVGLLNSKFCEHRNPEPWVDETQTLVSLRDFCLANPDWKILYMHTKGITQPMPSTHDWRKVMEYFCIEKWQEASAKLEEYDTVGCLYMDHCYYGYFPHYSGNFWWATSNYINKLDDSYLTGGIRQNREFWIGTGKGSMYSFHTTGLNHYAHEYPRNLYAS